MWQEEEVEDIWYGDHSDFPGYDDAKVADASNFLKCNSNVLQLSVSVTQTF